MINFTPEISSYSILLEEKAERILVHIHNEKIKGKKKDSVDCYNIVLRPGS